MSLQLTSYFGSSGYAVFLSSSNNSIILIILDQNELTQALAYLEQFAASNFPEYIRSLSELLGHAEYSPVARMASGLQLKNLLTSKDVSVKGQYKARWLSLSDEIRSYVKKNVSKNFCTWPLVFSVFLQA